MDFIYESNINGVYILNGRTIPAKGYIREMGSGSYDIKFYNSETLVTLYLHTNKAIQKSEKLTGSFNKYNNLDDAVYKRNGLSMDLVLTNNNPLQKNEENTNGISENALSEDNISEETSKSIENGENEESKKIDLVDNAISDDNTDKEELTVINDGSLENNDECKSQDNEKNNVASIPKSSSPKDTFLNMNKSDETLLMIILGGVILLGLLLKWLYFKKYLPLRRRCKQCGRKDAMVIIDEEYSHYTGTGFTVKQDRKCKYCGYEDGVLRKRSANYFLG